MRKHTPKLAGRRTRLVATAVCAIVLAVGAAGASAAVPTVQWRLVSQHGPQNMPLGGTGEYVLLATNLGDKDANAGGDLQIVDTLPAGVTATAASGPDWNCSRTSFPAAVVTCTNPDVVSAPTVGVVPASSRGAAPVLYIDVTVAAGAGGANTATVSSDGVSAGATDPTTFSDTPAGFGLSGFVADAFASSADAAATVHQAGGHPAEARFDLDFNLTQTTDGFGRYTQPDGNVRTVVTELPAGFVGDPQATPQCTDEQFSEPSGTTFATSCPPSTQVGTIDISMNDLNKIAFGDVPDASQDIAVYNLVPPRGTLAEFGFTVQNLPVRMVASLDPAHGYAVKVTISQTTPLFPLRSAHLSLWGVPADPSHDALRYLSKGDFTSVFGTGAGVAPRPFLTLPSQCDSAVSTSLQLDSWQGASASTTSAPATMTGCEKQQFGASISVQPTTTKVDSPTGLDFRLSIPQADSYAGLGTPPLRQAVVTLPEGMTVSPSSAGGLAACTSAQIGLGTDREPACPDAAKVGSVKLITPLLAQPVDGSVYLAAQTDNPFGSLLALYIVLEDRDRGLLIKLPGRIETDPSTGRVVTTFDDNPQLPFSELDLHFKSGPRAPLATPPVCTGQPLTTTAVLTSWNSALPPVTATDTFAVSSDGNGGACAAQGFHPGFSAGTEDPVAGKDSPLVTTITRPDGDQALGSVAVSMPQGVLGRIANVTLCSDAAAAANACPEDSRIGTATVAAGPGSNPFYISDGRVYITEPYKGAPFGLAIVVHAQAGPFDLGLVTVRAQIQVDRRTAALKVVTDPLPTILDGIPLRLRVASVTVDRPHFTFNPTSCAVKHVDARIASDSGTAADVSSRFQVGDCGRLPFAPKLSFAVGSRRHTGRGASTPLTTTLLMPKGDANLAGVRVVLPTTINARLPVINNACTRAAFDAGNCAKAKAGTAVAVTPLLRAPLRGGVYFVRNGRPLPDLMIALRGQVAVDVTARVSIPGGTRLGTNFDTVPDVPITKFTLHFVSGSHGPVGAARNLCTARSRRTPMEVAFTAQSGKRIERSQRMTIRGCAKKAGRGHAGSRSGGH